MPLDRLSQFHLGAVDGKHEYIETSAESLRFFDTFLMPETVSEPVLLSGEKFLVRGFRGTGKTSLLHWIAKKHREAGAQGQFVLFKTDLSESKRMEISKQAGIRWENVASEKIEMLQDFKEAWRWFLHRKIAEILIESGVHCAQPAEFAKYKQLLGLGERSWFEKVIGEFPKVEAAKIRIKGLFDFIEAEFSGDIHVGSTKSISFSSVLHKLDTYLARIGFASRLYLCLDELEVFYHSNEQYKRDLRMVRDLLFAVSAFSSFIKSRNLSIKLYAAVRLEVLDAIGSDGQEVTRLVQDLGVNIAWHYANRSLQHPLFNMLRRKIWSSEARRGIAYSRDPIAQYFPAQVSGQPLEVFLLDQSFYKPRDLVLRLKVAQEQFPLNSSFDAVVLTKTDIDYSAKMWEEVTYELSAMYSAEEVRVIESLFSGRRTSFRLDEVAE